MAVSAKTGWAIMGTETIATEHMVSSLRAAGHCPLWVVSRDIAFAQAFAGDLDIPNATDNVAEVWADGNVRFVYVSATRDRRPFHVEAAARAGKHILCDGPICEDRHHASKLVKLCADRKVMLAVHHLARASNVHQTMKRMIREGEIGQLQSITVIGGGAFHPPPNRRELEHCEQGDIFFDAGMESIDLARYITEAAPRQIVGVTRPGEDPAQHLAFTLRMDDGCIVQSHESFLTSDIEDTVLVAGSRGSLLASGTMNGRGAGTLTRRLAGRNELIPIRERDTHLSAIQDFVTGLHGKPRWLSTGCDSVINLKVLEALKLSLAEKRLVDISV